MNKIALTITLLCLILSKGKAQEKPARMLTGTSWKGTVYAPDPLTCVIKFGKDTVRLLYVDGPEISITDNTGESRTVTGKDSASLESMTYRLNGDTIELHKVAGGSPCGDEKGTYRAQVSNGKLKLIPIQDLCGARPYAFKEEMAEIK